MLENPKIWLVDDDQSIINIIKRAFEKQQLSCQVAGFNDAQEIISALQSDNLPTLLMIDYSMPGMDGIELIEWLKQNSTTRSLKIVLFSQFMSKDLVEKAQKLGVYEVAMKPFSFVDWCVLARDLCLAGHFD
ncbi:response regulator [Larkinella harenae]